ncbi:Rcs stress response system protein RcsF [Ferrimonas balearica]|uniref:Rcs stress response system protein RcsF n=1 Tax=Ferrimonas balearica TaxID=44012 RepID=UPI001C99578F|nr:Rcs stress response system protein RcsF [Ferrimonas balearica]MBY5990681.1 hypothetical protein [Ferrimonas balearica]
MPLLRSLLPILLLAGCAGDYHFSSNLDPANFDDYFQPGQVKLLGPETAIGNAEVLGVVEGISCQESARSVPASDADARTQMRLEAGKLGANAVRLHQCMVLEEHPGCVVARACYGQALKMVSQDER